MSPAWQSSPRELLPHNPASPPPPGAWDRAVCCTWIRSSSGYSTRWDSRKEISSSVAACFSSTGWKRGRLAVRSSVARSSSGSSCKPRAIPATRSGRERGRGLAHQQHAEGRKVVCQDAAVAVQNAPARRDDGKIADAVAFRQIQRIAGVAQFAAASIPPTRPRKLAAMTY